MNFFTNFACLFRVIHGYDVILDEETSRLNSNYIFEKQISNSNGGIQMKFSRRLTTDVVRSASNFVNLGECLNDEDGVSMFLLNGSLSNNAEILFNSTSVPKSIGPFCFGSCINDKKRVNELDLADFASDVL